MQAGNIKIVFFIIFILLIFSCTKSNENTENIETEITGTETEFDDEQSVNYSESAEELIFTVNAYNYDPTPQLHEYVDLWSYSPLNENNRLAVLDERAGYRVDGYLFMLDGATAFFPLYAAFAKATYPENYWKDWSDFHDKGYHRDMQFAVRCSRTADAYNNLLNGTVDIIFCLEPSQEHQQQFRDKNMNLKLVPIGREAFVFFTHKNNPVSNITIENIQGIYSGRIRNWSELGGRNNDIIAFQRPENSGSQTILNTVMKNIPIVRPPREIIMPEMGDIINRVASYRNLNEAIGYSFLIYATEMVKNDQIKLLSINGVHPSLETIKNNTYPFSVNIYAVYVDNNYNDIDFESFYYYLEHKKSFVEWILSRQGQLLVSRTGYVPINNN